MACNRASGLASKMCGPTVGASWSSRYTRISHKSAYDRSSLNGHMSACRFNVELDCEFISIRDQDADTVLTLFLADNPAFLFSHPPLPGSSRFRSVARRFVSFVFFVFFSFVSFNPSGLTRYFTRSAWVPVALGQDWRCFSGL